MYSIMLGSMILGGNAERRAVVVIVIYCLIIISPSQYGMGDHQHKRFLLPRDSKVYGVKN